jgi:hypothetical protein
MMEEKWEPLATRMANCREERLADLIGEIVLEQQIDMGKSAKIGIAMDTR